MCGRYTVRASRAALAKAFGVSEVPDLPPRYNIAPTQPVPAVRLNTPDEREMVMLRWGLVPSWADDLKIGNRMINARADTAPTKPSFRSAFKSRRCLVVTDGFYEWKKEGTKKQPFYIRRKDERPFAFAGLWERWEKDGPAIETCTILTTDANDLMKPIHDRMPVILAPADHDVWLDAKPATLEQAKAMTRPYEGSDLEAVPVSTVVNNPKHEGPDCIKPLA